MIAALFVDPKGVYSGLPDVDVWGEERDARLYDGPWPVVAHPPCERWGRYWHGGPSARVRRVKGDDGGCFASALMNARRVGGVLEHPEASAAWKAFGLSAPPKSGGWINAGDFLGWTCCVEQGHYGHRARKATWLYAVALRGYRTRDFLPELTWGPSAGVVRLDAGFHSAEERARSPHRAKRDVGRLTAAEALATPPAFRDVLLAIARSVRR